MKFKEEQPIYLQIADLICENILSGRWPPGERIPSVRDAAVSMEVNPNTALRAYDYLQNLGIIYKNRGIGYFVAEDGPEKTRVLKREDFFSNILPNVIKTMKLLGIQYAEIEKYFD